MQDVLIIDKPSGMTSHTVVQQVKRITGAAKAGHAGTLDPMATGVLIVCLNKATKRQNDFMTLDKEYRATLRLGIQTDTADLEGKTVQEQAVPPLSESQVLAVFQGLTGAQEQLPPMYSAIKFQGRCLYRYAREGKEVARIPRSIVVHQLLLERLQAGEIDFFVNCSKGTYVRTLGEEIAARLGTLGHLSKLQRVACGPYRVDQAHSLEHLKGLYK